MTRSAAHMFGGTLLAVACSLPVQSLAETPGRLLASQCAQCHGTNGRSVSDIDGLAGESAQEILEELREMKASADTGDIMHRQAKGYTDEQLQLIANYFATLRGNGEAE